MLSKPIKVKNPDKEYFNPDMLTYKLRGGAKGYKQTKGFRMFNTTPFTRLYEYCKNNCPRLAEIENEYYIQVWYYLYGFVMYYEFDKSREKSYPSNGTFNTELDAYLISELKKLNDKK